MPECCWRSSLLEDSTNRLEAPHVFLKSRRMNCRNVTLVLEPNALASGFLAMTATGNPRLAPSAQFMRLLLTKRNMTTGRESVFC